MTGEVPGRKVFAVVARPGRHCLESIRAPRVRLVPPEDVRNPHQVVLIPFSDDVDLPDQLPGLPGELWTGPRAGRAKLVLDASLEGRPHDPKWTRALERFLEGAGVPLSQVVYVTQDRGYAQAYADFRREAGLGPGMKVVVFDYWPRAVARQHEENGKAEFEARLAAFRARPKRRPWRFLSLNRILRPTKTLFVLRLIEDGLFDQGAISLVPVIHRMWKMEAAQLSHPAFSDLNPRLAPLLPRLRELAGKTFRTDKGDPKLGPVLDDPLAEYGETWFSMVTETEMLDRPSRITEKPLKPLLNFHPLLVLGNPGALKLIRGYGFQTFQGFIDESYDDELDPRRRFEMVYDEFRRLCALEEAEIDRLEAGLEEVLIFNARHGLIDLPKLFRSRYDPALVGDILSPATG